MVFRCKSYFASTPSLLLGNTPFNELLNGPSPPPPPPRVVVKAQWVRRARSRLEDTLEEWFVELRSVPPVARSGRRDGFISFKAVLCPRRQRDRAKASFSPHTPTSIPLLNLGKCCRSTRFSGVEGQVRRHCLIRARPKSFPFDEKRALQVTSLSLS